MPRQPPGHARVCRRHQPMCAGSAAICWTAWNWRAGASSRVSSPGPRPAPRRRWMRWNRSSPGISRPGSEAARRRSGTRRPAIRGELPLAADHGMSQSRAGRSAGAGHSPQRVGTRHGERAVRDCVRLGRLSCPRSDACRAPPEQPCDTASPRSPGASRHDARSLRRRPRPTRALTCRASGRARSGGTYGREAGTGVRPRPGVWLTARPLRRRMATAPDGRGYDRPALLRAAVERSRRPVAHVLARRSGRRGL